MVDPIYALPCWGCGLSLQVSVVAGACSEACQLTHLVCRNEHCPVPGEPRCARLVIAAGGDSKPSEQIAKQEQYLLRLMGRAWASDSGKAERLALFAWLDAEHGRRAAWESNIEKALERLVTP